MPIRPLFDIQHLMHARFRLYGCCLAFVLAGFSADMFAGGVPVSGPAYQGLEGALQAVMHLNPQVKEQQAQVEYGESGLKAAKAGRLPTLAAQANNIDNVSQAVVMAKQPLWAFGRIDNAIDLARTSLDADGWDMLALQRELIMQTSVVYARVEGVRARLAVSAGNMEEHNQLYERIRRRADGQMASASDVNLAYARLVQARSANQQMTGELLTAETELLALTQQPVDSTLPVNRGLLNLPDADRLRQQVVDDNPQMQALRKREDMAGLEIRQEKANAMPTLYFQVEKSLQETTDAHVNDTRAGLVVEAQLGGSGFAAYNRVQGAQARYRASQYNLDGKRVELQQTLDNLLVNRRVTGELLLSQQETVTMMTDLKESFLRQYDSGRKTWVEVMNIQRELTELRYQLIQTENQWLILSLRVAALAGLLDAVAGLHQNNSHQDTRQHDAQ